MRQAKEKTEIRKDSEPTGKVCIDKLYGGEWFCLIMPASRNLYGYD